MIPIQYSANVKLPYVGWCGDDGFSCLQEARDCVAKILRQARRGDKIAKPSSRTAYVIRPQLMRFED